MRLPKRETPLYISERTATEVKVSPALSPAASDSTARCSSPPVSSSPTTRAYSAVRWSCAACSAATTAPAEDVANKVVQSPLHDVTIRFDSITVMGTCDNNSLFETKEDGEFELEFQVWNAAGTSMDWSRKPYGPLTKGTHRIPYVATVRRDVSMDTGLRVHFWASEKDGLLGNDPDMSRKNRWMTHQYDGSGWTGGRKIELVGGEPLPAVGFGMGDVVLGELLQERGLRPEPKRALDHFIVAQRRGICT